MHPGCDNFAYWIVSVTKYRLKLKEYPNVRWDEIMRIAQAQVVVTAEMDYKEFIAQRKATAENQAREYFYRQKERKPYYWGEGSAI